METIYIIWEQLHEENFKIKFTKITEKRRASPILLQIYLITDIYRQDLFIYQYIYILQ
jgi:hypothetical protein